MENKKNTAIDFANLIISYASEMPDNKGNLTPIKLQKILYYVYVECLLTHKVKLFDAPIEKWKFGPVVSSVYHNFKNYGVNNIKEPTSSFVFEMTPQGLQFEEIPFTRDSIEVSSEIKETIKTKVNELIDRDPFELVNKTHRETPWKNFESQILRGDRGLIYSDDELIEFFTKTNE